VISGVLVQLSGVVAALPRGATAVCLDAAKFGLRSPRRGDAALHLSVSVWGVRPPRSAGSGSAFLDGAGAGGPM